MKNKKEIFNNEKPDVKTCSTCVHKNKAEINAYPCIYCVKHDYSLIS